MHPVLWNTLLLAMHIFPRTCVTILEKVNIEPSQKKQQQADIPVNSQRSQQHHGSLSSENWYPAEEEKKRFLHFYFECHTVNFYSHLETHGALAVPQGLHPTNQPIWLHCSQSHLLPRTFTLRRSFLFLFFPTTAQLLNGFPSFPLCLHLRCSHRYKITIVHRSVSTMRGVHQESRQYPEENFNECLTNRERGGRVQWRHRTHGPTI